MSVGRQDTGQLWAYAVDGGDIEMRAVSVFLLTMISFSLQALACVTSPEEAVYQVQHEKFGTIGQEVITRQCKDDQLIIDRKVEVDVRLLFATVYHRDAHYIETWQDDRLVRFEGYTNDNGETFTLVARSIGNGPMVVDGPDGEAEIPKTAIPTDPWTQNLIGRALHFDRTNGDLMEVNVVDAGPDKIEIGGAPVWTHKFILSSKREQELWFGLDGTWLKSKIQHASGVITITRLG